MWICGSVDMEHISMNMFLFRDQTEGCSKNYTSLFGIWVFSNVVITLCVFLLAMKKMQFVFVNKTLIYIFYSFSVFIASLIWTEIDGNIYGYFYVVFSALYMMCFINWHIKWCVRQHST